MKTAENFVQIQQGSFKALVRPENLAKVEDKLAKVKPPVHSIRKPSALDRARVFPMYEPGMSTAEYVRQFEDRNVRLISVYSAAGSHPINCQPAVQYDPLVPVCVEDKNPDYVLGVDDIPIKTKRGSKVAQMQVALNICIEQMLQAQKIVDCREFDNAIYAAQKALNK